MFELYSELDFMVLYMLVFYKYEDEVNITLDEVLTEFPYNAKQASGFWYENEMEEYLDLLLDGIEYEILRSTTKLGDLL